MNAAFDPLPGEVIGIADNLGWPIELGGDVCVHFDGPNHRVVIRAKSVADGVSKRPPRGGLHAIEAVLRVHSGEEFESADFPTAEEGRDAWLAWQDVRATVEEACPDADA